MSVIAIPYGETAEKFLCVEIVKQSWLPGQICLPIFHCQRCLALWRQKAHVPGSCDEVICTDHDRLVPINIRKCDLVTKLFNNQKGTGTRLCKQLPDTKPVKLELKPKKTEERKVFQPIPVAEFVDFDKQLRKYREKFTRKLKGILSEQKGMCRKTTGRACSPLNDLKTESKTKFPGRDTTLEYDNESEDKAKMEIISVAECAEERVQDDLKCGTQVYDKDESLACQNSKFHKKHDNNARMHDKSCFAKHKSGCQTRPSTSVQKNRLEKGLTIASKNEATRPAVTKTTKLIPRQTTKLKTRRPCRPRLPSTEVPLDVACDKKSEESRKEVPVFDKQALRVVFGDRLETVFGDNLEKLDANVVNSEWFQSLIEEFHEQEEQLRAYRSDLTRSFVFSYFDLLKTTRN